jgi:hypothetical protein
MPLFYRPSLNSIAKYLQVNREEMVSNAGGGVPTQATDYKISPTASSVSSSLHSIAQAILSSLFAFRGTIISSSTPLMAAGLDSMT